MRPIWKGHISFGLVTIPVTLYPAEERAELRLHMVDSRNHARVRYERVNAETGEEVPWGQVVKGYEFSEGSYVLLSDAELKKAAPEATRTVDIEAFVDLAEIDPLYFDRPYYLEPGKGGRKGYVLLRETLREMGKVGIARVVIRAKQYLAALLPRGDVLALVLMRYANEVRGTKGLDIPAAAGAGVQKGEMKMARMLVGSMSRAWKPAEYHDEYREALMKWIEKKAKAGELEAAPEMRDEDEPPAPIDIMEALRKSMEGRGGGGGAREAKKRGPVARKRTPARRRAG